MNRPMDTISCLSRVSVQVPGFLLATVEYSVVVVVLRLFLFGRLKCLDFNLHTHSDEENTAWLA